MFISPTRQIDKDVEGDEGRAQALCPSRLMEIKTADSMFVKIGLFCGMSFLASFSVQAQTDVVAMQIGSRTVTREELAYAYKNYVATDKGRRKTVDLFVQQFTTIQRKAIAAREAKLDTSAFIRETMNIQKSKLLRPLYLTDAEKNEAALKVYTATKNEFKGKPLLKVVTIFRYLPQNATSERQQREQRLIDSLYNVLQRGGDFIALARRYSSSGESVEGYVPSWLATGTTWSDYETQAYMLKPGEYSKPFLAVRGFYIVKLLDERPFPTFEDVKPRLLKYMDNEGITLRLVQEKLGKESEKTRGKNERDSSLLSKYPVVRWQLKGFEDALLASEWDKQQESATEHLQLKYPVEVYEKVIRTLENDYAK